MLFISRAARTRVLQAAALASFILCAPARAKPPKDFDKFWKQVRAELDAVPAAAVFAPDAENTDAQVACYKASYASLGGKRVHARYCRPAADGRYPAVLISPWYGLGALPVPKKLPGRGVAAFWFQARGFEVDQKSYPTENSWYILDGIDDPRTYVFREIAAHGLRALDVMASRPELDSSRFAAMGASQGGGLSLILAAVDRRVKFVAADFPFLSDWEGSLAAATEGPFRTVAELIEKEPARAAGIRKTVSYFDALNAAPKVTAPALVQAGLKDKSCVAAGVRKVYAALRSGDKKLVEFPEAGHGDLNADRWHAIEDFVSARLTAR